MQMQKQFNKQNLFDTQYNDNAIDAGNDQSMFDLTNLEKIKEMRLKFSQ